MNRFSDIAGAGAAGMGTPGRMPARPGLLHAAGASQTWAVDHPASAIVTMVGLLVAIILLPDDVEPSGALALPTAVFVASLCLVPLLSSLHNLKNVFRAEHVLMLSPVYWLLLDPLQGRGELIGVAPTDVQRSFIAIAVFILGAWFAFLQRPWRAPRLVREASRAELPTAVCFGIGLLAFTLAFLRYAIPSGFDVHVMWQALMGNRFAGPWQRDTLGGADAFLDHLSYFGYLLPPLAALLGRRHGWTDRRTVVLLLLSLVQALFVVQGGGRRTVGLFLGSGILFWFLGSPRIRFSTVLVLFLAMGGLTFVLDDILSYRGTGAISALMSDTATPERREGEGLIRVDDNFLRLVQLIEIFPERHAYTTWRYPLWVAVRPVPRLFWPGKPVDPGFDLSEGVGVKGASLSASVIGELVMAGGLFAVLLGGWFYGRVARSLSVLLAEGRTSSALLIYCIGLFALFIGMRSMIELVLTSYVILAWVLLVRAYQGFRT
jgi:hypothetical protein